MKTESLNVLIVGGGGYIGFHTGLSLWERGHKVILFDIIEPDTRWISRSSIFTQTTKSAPGTSRTIVYYGNGEGNRNQLKFIEGSLLNAEALNSVFFDVDCVIHCASYGMSGKEQMPAEWTKTELVNVKGTSNVVKACLSAGVRGLVYTSTYNVVFGGQEIIDGDETLPYFPLHQHVDHYSRTKAIAEQFVLLTDGLCQNVNKNMPRAPLRTCALRLAGVMGLGETRHLPRIVKSLDLMKFRYGYGDSLVQFVTLKNVVQAHVKAAERLLSIPTFWEGKPISLPINNFEFFRPLMEALDYSYPSLVLPMWLIWMVVYLIQFTHSLCSKIHPGLTFTPMLTPAEVYKTGVTHYFSCDKARMHFGYCPEQPNDISDAIQYFKQEKEKSGNKKGFV
ncbi:Short-chain dehydrogenase/reductase family 42E member 1, partial [Orchesella cincta]